MMNEKPTLKSLLETSSGKKLLLLGKEKIFTQKEIARFLKRFKVAPVNTLEEGVVGVVEHHRLNPVEEDISNDAYEQKLPIYKLSEFEQLLSEEIDDDALLMAIKLGNEQERVRRLLGNPHLSDALFVRLLKLYRFDEEEEDSRDDRDVIMHTLRRYIAIKPNEEDLLYSYLTLRRLATEATDPGLLEALMGFPNFSFLVRGKESITLKETIARNPHINETTIQKLLSLRNRAIESSLAGNSSISEEVQKLLLGRHDEKIARALAANPAITDAIFAALLTESEAVVSLLLVHQPVNVERLQQIEAAVGDDVIFALLGANEMLESDVIKQLTQKEGNESLHQLLCENKTVPPALLEAYYQLKQRALMPALAQNPSTPVWILDALYKDDGEATEIAAALARNPSTPKPVLRALFEKDDFEINRALATNASLPMELLDVLKLDTRLQNELAQNERLASSFETVLNQGKVMLNV
ncbi:Leucine rich repeat variant [hydrothermal vent metagenome]|uniref:Leucine rich repeat variant n=1 Tax=hydrothermal vent metagenome TaxID=652676 RepID=A0A1W1EAB6_9ZZZZ